MRCAHQFTGGTSLSHEHGRRHQHGTGGSASRRLPQRLDRDGAWSAVIRLVRSGACGKRFGNCTWGWLPRGHRAADLRIPFSDPLIDGGTGPCGQSFGNFANEGEAGRKEGVMREPLTIEEVAERLRVKVLTTRWLRQESRFPLAMNLRVHLARGGSRPQGRPAGPGARLGRHDDGPRWPPHRQEPLGRRGQCRGHNGGTGPNHTHGRGTRDHHPERLTWRNAVEPPVGVEPTTYSLRVKASTTASPEPPGLAT